MDTLQVASTTPAILAQYDRLEPEAYMRMKTATRIWRDTLLLMLLRNTGFRPVEVCQIQARELMRDGPTYYVMVTRGKKRDKAAYEPVFLHPNLGQPLVEYVRGENRRPGDSLFGIKERQLRDICYKAGEKGIGRRVAPKEFRRLYIRTVAKIAADVVGFEPRHMEVAQLMVGHASVRTTWDWYYDLSLEERREIQERIPV